MKTIILLIILIIPLTSIAQFKKLKEPYAASNGVTYSYGDTIKIGRGSAPNGNFMHFQMTGLMAQMGSTSAGTEANMLNRSYAGTNAKIINLYTHNLNGVKKIVAKVNVGGVTMGGYLLYLEDAIASCEVLPCANEQEGTTVKKEDKYDKLKKLKGLLDESVLTQEEYDTEKKKLLDEN